MLVHHAGIAERSEKEAKALRAEIDDYVRRVVGRDGAAAEIEKVKELLDSGAIDQREFDAIKQKAVAAA